MDLIGKYLMISEKHQFAMTLKDHLYRTRINYPDLEKFLNKTFIRSVITSLSIKVVASLSRQDFRDHMINLIDPPVSFIITILDESIQEASHYLQRQYGGYLQLMEKFLNDSQLMMSNSVLCHIIYGHTSRGTWLNMAIIAVTEQAPVSRNLFPIELLTEEEREVIKTANGKAYFQNSIQ